MGTAQTTTLAAYLHRLGEPVTPPPTYETLRRLCRAHLMAVPWQSLHVQLGEVTPVDGLAAASRLARGASGYCFHLNGAFAWLLDRLGFTVERHRAGVLMAGGEATIDEAHLTLVVTGLPTPAWPEGRWLVDVALVDVTDEPLALRQGTFSRDGWSFDLRPSELAPGAWRLDHDPRGSFVALDIGAEVLPIGHFAASHTRQSTGPDSTWRTWSIVERRRPHGTLRLVGCELTTWHGVESRTVILSDEQAWRDALRLLHFEVDAVPSEDLHGLWLRIHAARRVGG